MRRFFVNLAHVLFVALIILALMGSCMEALDKEAARQEAIRLERCYNQIIPKEYCNGTFHQKEGATNETENSN